MDAIGPLAAKGLLVSVGGFTRFGPSHPGLFGRQDFRGVGYAYPYNLKSAIPKGAALDECLAVIA